MFHIIWVLSLKLISIVWFPNAFSLPHSIFKTSLEYTLVAPLVNSFAVKLVIEVTAWIYISVYEFLDPVAILNAYLDLSFVVKPVTVEYDRLARLLSVFKGAHVLVAILVDVLSIAMRLAVLPLSVICNKMLVISCLANLYHSFSVSVSVFEASKIEIFAWYVFESKAVLFSFTWKVRIPLPKIKCAVEVPKDIFVWFHLIVNSIFEFPDNQFLSEFLDI